jgi:hypothetical protein
MSTSVVSPPNVRARGVEFVTDAVVFHLEDGRSVTVPSNGPPGCATPHPSSAATGN